MLTSLLGKNQDGRARSRHKHAGRHRMASQVPCGLPLTSPLQRTGTTAARTGHYLGQPAFGPSRSTGPAAASQRGRTTNDGSISPVVFPICGPSSIGICLPSAQLLHKICLWASINPPTHHEDFLLAKALPLLCLHCVFSKAKAIFNLGN